MLVINISAWYCKNDDKYQNYKGEWNLFSGKHGWGLLICNEYRYIGIWKNNRQNGRGLLSKDCGTQYSGDFVNNKMNGFGFLKTLSFDYVGEFKNGFKDGIGIQKSHENYNIIISKWEKGKQLEGYGVIINKEGIYEGMIRNNEKHGEGIFLSSNGIVFIGKFINNIANGFGFRYVYQDQNIVVLKSKLLGMLKGNLLIRSHTFISNDDIEFIRKISNYPILTNIKVYGYDTQIDFLHRFNQNSDYYSPDKHFFGIRDFFDQHFPGLFSNYELYLTLKENRIHGIEDTENLGNFYSCELDNSFQGFYKDGKRNGHGRLINQRDDKKILYETVWENDSIVNSFGKKIEKSKNIEIIYHGWLSGLNKHGIGIMYVKIQYENICKGYKLRGVWVNDYPYRQEICEINDINSPVDCSLDISNRNECCICFDPLDDDNIRIIDECNHTICQSCLSKLPHDNCPCCRTKFNKSRVKSIYQFEEYFMGKSGNQYLHQSEVYLAIDKIKLMLNENIENQDRGCSPYFPNVIAWTLFGTVPSEENIWKKLIPKFKESGNLKISSHRLDDNNKFINNFCYPEVFKMIKQK